MSFVLDAYAARSCPLKTVNAFTPSLVAPSLSPPTPAFFRDAPAIEADVIERVSRANAVVDLRSTRDLPTAEAAAACIAAMSAGAPIIVGGLLPPDEAAHRIGRPSLLLRSPEDPGYHPVQIKFHRVLESAPSDDTTQTASLLRTPIARTPLPERRFRWTSRLNAALQLAHYWRLLEAAGFAAATPLAGLVGIDQVAADIGGEAGEPLITWLDLGARRVPPDPRWVEFPADAVPGPTVERYDREHAYRVDLAEAALASSGQETLLTPIVSPECRGCVWQPHCQAQLNIDDLSLRISKAPLDVHEVRTLRGLGISTVTELAQADLESLLEIYLPRASHREGSEIRLRRAHQRAQMMHAGVELERITDGPVPLPRHDLEIDIDVETSAEDRVYLWGFWVDDPRASAPYYRSFSRFGELNEADEADLAAEALAWLRSLAAGRDVAAYHYSDYEVLRIGRVAGKLDAGLAAWARQATQDWFVDLFALVRENFLGANGLGLKVVATAATGFAWRDEDANGLASQGWFADAVRHEDAGQRRLARVRVLEYNEDDVRATWHLRRWLRDQDEQPVAKRFPAAPGP
ncbi:MAG: TM0106 family RecB-like putative nuclease [Propioniciclava sp.]